MFDSSYASYGRIMFDFLFHLIPLWPIGVAACALFGIRIIYDDDCRTAN